MWPSINIDLGLFHGQLPLYPLMIGCGLCHLFLGVDFSARRKKRSPKMIGDFHYCLLAAFFSGLLCAIFITKFFYGSQVPWGTVAAMPGIAGGAAAMLLAARCFNVPLRDWLPLGLPFICFAHAWGRLGCFLGGCCYGKPTDSFLAVQFPANSLACQTHGHVPVHPTQLYELALLVALGLILHRIIPAAHRIYSYLLLYGLGRFAIEFLRGDDRGNLGLLPSLSPSQQICLLFIAAGLVLAWRQIRRTDEAGQP